MVVSTSEVRRSTVFVYSLIVERLADGILGVKHGVLAFVIQFLECYYNAATCCYLVDRVLIVRDSTALRIWQLRISGSSFRQKNKTNIYSLLPGMTFLSERWSLIGRGSHIK